MLGLLALRSLAGAAASIVYGSEIYATSRRDQLSLLHVPDAETFPSDVSEQTERSGSGGKWEKKQKQFFFLQPRGPDLHPDDSLTGAMSAF